MKPSFHERRLVEEVERGVFLLDSEGRFWRHGRRAENSTGSRGYLQMRMMIGGRRLHCMAHRLVWQCLHGDIPEGMQINHINGDKKDNRPSNLEIVSPSENARHAYRTGLKDEHGESNPAAKLPDASVAEIRAAYATGRETMEDIGKRFGVAYQTVSKIIRGERRARQEGPLSTSNQEGKQAGTPRDGAGRFTLEQTREVP